MSTINLLPDDYVHGRQRRRTNSLCLTLFAVVIAGVAGATVVLGRGLKTTQEVLTQVDQEYQDASKVIQRMQTLEKEKEDLHAKALASAALMERVPRSTLLGAIALALPKNCSMTRFELETHKQAPAPAAVKALAGKKGAKYAAAQKIVRDLPLLVSLKITGLAATDVEVARFIAGMARNPIVDVVDLVYSQEKVVNKNDPPAREFQVRIELKPDADAIALTDDEPSDPLNSKVNAKGPAISQVEADGQPGGAQ
jgi:Tfp pilus assembly protein PilN